jgi:chlorophyll synthase
MAEKEPLLLRLNSHTVINVLHATGAEFWMVAVFPFYIGYVVSTGELFPDARGILAGIIVGPVMAAFTFMFNDYYDLEDDRINPRKSAYSIIYRRELRPAMVLRTSILVGVAGLALSLAISPTLFLLTLGILLLSVMYSHRSIRLKARGGLDLLTNMIGLGILCPLAGWSIHEPVQDFPPFYLLSIFFVLGALYAPTTVADYEADKSNKVNTMAVRFGKRNTIRIGGVLLTLAMSILFIQGVYEDFPWTHEYLIGTWPFLVSQPFVYMWFLRESELMNIYLAIICVNMIQAIGVMVFLLLFVGAI